MAQKIEIANASGHASDGLTGGLISDGIAAKVTVNSRCAFWVTAQSLRRLADEIENGPGLLYDIQISASNERWAAESAAIKQSVIQRRPPGWGPV